MHLLVELLLQVVDVLIEFRSQFRVAEDFVIAEQQIEKETGQGNGNGAQHKARDGPGAEILFTAHIRVPGHESQDDPKYAADQAGRGIAAADQGSRKIKEAADQACDACNHGTGSQTLSGS